jgi:hypothetical protein
MTFTLLHLLHVWFVFPACLTIGRLQTYGRPTQWTRETLQCRESCCIAGDRTDWCSGKALVFGTYSVRISAGPPAILTEVYRGFFQSLEENCVIAPRLCYDCFHPPPFIFNDWFSGHYLSSKFLLKRRFGDWTLSPEIRLALSIGPNTVSFLPEDGERAQSPKRRFNKNRTVDNVQKISHCINIPSVWAFRPFQFIIIQLSYHSTVYTRSLRVW